MTAWNYRMVRRDDVLTIHEVYYGDNDSVLGWIEREANPVGFDAEELAGDLRMMGLALDKPVLVLSADGDTLIEEGS